MFDRPPTWKGDADQEAADRQKRYHALLGLYSLANQLGGIDLGDVSGFQSAPPATALQLVADAPEDQISASARLDVLYQLTAARLPAYDNTGDAYRQLAESVVGPGHGDQLLSDLKAAATDGVPFESTASGQALPHHVTAFLGQDICNTRAVEVGGLKATWIFSEFETDAPLEGITQWLDPRNWTDWGQTFFKRMDVVASEGPVSLSDPGEDHWHAVFHEEVQIVWPLNTLLHCDFWTDRKQASGMTYELDVSLDRQIGVDRGFLIVSDFGSVRRVRALKIVGFTQPGWDDFALFVRPFWTDWMRSAVRSGSHSAPKSPTKVPSGDDGSKVPSGQLYDQWVKYFGESARTYAGLFDDLTSRVAAGNYNLQDGMADGTKVWAQLAADWTAAWNYGMDTMGEISGHGIDAGLTPPGTPREQARGSLRALASGSAAMADGAARTFGMVMPGATGAAFGAAAPAGPGARAAAPPQPTPPEGGPVGTGPGGPIDSRPTTAAPESTIVPVQGLRPNDALVISALTSIEAGGAVVPADAIQVTVTALDDGTYGAEVVAIDAVVAPGLYLGQLTRPDGSAVAPVQLYIARASGPA
ncbi:hypothetical protein GCM10027053_45420 [Intrasporangium mesophilum]